MLIPTLQQLDTFSQLRHQMDRLLGGVPWDGSNLSWPPSLRARPAFRARPAANFWESGDSFHLEMEVPGVSKDQLDILVVGDELTVKVDRPETEQEGVIYHRRERSVGSFTRIIRLPASVEAAKVEAELHDGVLTIRLPKAENARPRRVKVAAGSPSV